MKSRILQSAPVALLASSLLAIGILAAATDSLHPRMQQIAKGPREEALMRDLRQIAIRPHPMGTEDHDRVRDYIFDTLDKLGLAPEIQRATITWDAGELVRAADVQNIVARLPGLETSGKAVLVVSHYDTAPQSPGAADDGASVVSMLELARLRTGGTQLLHPIILLFTDGEEWGLLGARAFVEQHPWANEIGGVINLEARGSGGRPFIFEMNGSTSRLATHLNDCSSPALAASYTETAYRRTGNDTDFTVFRGAGLPGYNVAFFDDSPTYHSSRDTVANLNPSSLLMQANTLFTLADCTARVDAASFVSGPQAIYVTLPGDIVLHYPQSWAVPFALIALLGVIAATLYPRRQAAFKSVMHAAATCLLVAASAGGLAWALNKLALTGLDPRLVRWETHDTLLVGALAIASTLVWLSLSLNAGRFSRRELFLGMLVDLALLNGLCSIFFPEASYLLLVPVLCGSLLSFVDTRIPTHKNALWHVVACGVLLGPGTFLWAQVISVLATVLGVRAQFPILFLCVVLAFWILAYAANWIGRARRIACAAALLAFGFLLCARLTTRFDANRPMPDSVILAADWSQGQAIWSTFDEKLDEWSRLYITQPQQRNLGKFFGDRQVNVLASPAAFPDVAAPDAKVIHSDESEITLLLKPQARIAVMRSDIYTDSEIQAISVQGRSVLPPSNRQLAGSAAAFTLVYLNPPDRGVVLRLRLSEPTSVGASVVNVTYGLDRDAGVLRPPHIIAGSENLTDVTLIRREFHFN